MASSPNDPLSLSRRSAVQSLLTAALFPALIPAAVAQKPEDVLALHRTAETGDAEAAKKLLAADPKLVDARTPGGITALGRAVVHGKVEVVRVLLDAGANPDLAKPDGAAPLHDAANQRDIVLMTLLLDHKANTEARWKEGSTPLAVAAADRSADPAPARLLLDRGAKVNSRADEGQSPLHNAVRMGGAAVVKLLVERGADPNSADKAGQTPLLIALAAVMATDPPPPEGAVGLLEALPVSLRLERTPLKDAVTQMFSAAKVSHTIETDAALNTPMTLTASGTLRSVLTTLRRLARAAGQPFVVTTTGGTLRVVREGSAGAVSGAPVAAAGATSTHREEWPAFTTDPRFRFYKTISQEVLENYLGRAVTHFGLLASSPEPSTASFADDLRMLKSVGAKFIGRAAYAWVPPDDDEAHFRQAAEAADRAHAADPEMLIQACVFETAYQQVEKIPVPDWVFEEFGQKPEKRGFRYRAMLYSGGRLHDHWQPGASVPDMSQLETRMWFFYRARRYLDAGCESIHFGQVHLMDLSDPQHHHWDDILTRIRRYATQSARRRFVLCDAHTHGVIREGQGSGGRKVRRLLFDLHSWPLRPAEAEQEGKAVMRGQYGDSIIRHSVGGVTPSGWECEFLPYMVEFDNFGSSGKAGQKGVGLPWVWGYDEISWFASRTGPERDAFLRQAWAWLRAYDPNGHLQLPTRRVLADPVNGIRMYQANNKSAACLTGFGQEDTIRRLFTSRR